MKPELLLVDDDESLGLAIRRYFGKAGFSVSTATTLRAGREFMDGHRISVLLLDLNLPDGSGLEWIRTLREENPKLALIVVTGSADVPTAVEAMRRGADHFVTKPVSLGDLSVFLQKAMEMGNLRQREAVHRRLASPPDLVMGSSAEALKVLKLAGIAAAGDSPVLLLGETGAGKGVLARWLHHGSVRRGEPFVEINCSGLRGELLANELFGHAKGAFTSAGESRQGLLEAAHGGTLFLDEIGDMELPVQAQFLKTIEEKKYRRLGETTIRVSEFRLVCATNRDLEEEVREGRFRQDLYFRINVFPIRLPPLRERPGDLPILAEHLLKRLGGDPGPLSPEALSVLASYDWPGNVRELRNVLERAILLSTGDPITAEHLCGLFPERKWRTGPLVKTRVKAPSLSEIRETLEKTGGDRIKAASILGISRATFYRILKKHSAGQS
jgi:DNA-binding NtrC family response regulator